MFAQQNWYVAARSSELSREPIARRILEQDLVLFRDNTGEARALHAMCAHRGGNLGRGRVVDGCIECPWHGWRYAGDGTCTHIPSIGPEGKVPNLARVPSFPVHEAQGFIYVWTSAEHAPDWTPRSHDFFDADFHEAGPALNQKGNFINTIEGACDDSHVFIAHRKTIGRGMPAQLAPISIVDEDADGRGLEAAMRWPAEQQRPLNGFNKWLNNLLLGTTENTLTADKTFRVEMTCLVIHKYVKADGNELIIYAFVTPSDATHNWFFAGFIDTNPRRSRLSKLAYRMMLGRQLQDVFAEDQDVIGTALSDDLPGGHPQPVSVNADLVGLGFRRMYARQVEREGAVPAWPVARSKPQPVA